MLLPIIAVLLGLLVLIWSADRFIGGATGVARHFGMSPMLIGILIVGFGTSAPELVVSTIAALDGNPQLALGNAYGSNIANIALILGCTALAYPLAVNSSVLKKELPILAGATAAGGYLLWDLQVSTADGIILVAIFALIMGWSTLQGRMSGAAGILPGHDEKPSEEKTALGASLGMLILGILLLTASSRAMVWGATEVAIAIGVSDLVIGLTIVAVGTSLPELASSITASRKGEHDMVLGNIIGSNLFNTLMVVGLAALIHPYQTVPDVLWRDIPTGALVTGLLFVLCYGKGGKGRIPRAAGALLLALFASYNAWIYLSVVQPAGS